MKTLLLDQTTWDLILDANGNIAVAEQPYSIAQDAASAVKLFSGELWYDTAKGLPYFSQILGHSPPISLLKTYIAKAVATVPNVVSVNVVLTPVADRKLSGSIYITDNNSEVSFVSY